MSQITNIIVSIIALIIIFFFIRTARLIQAPNIFTLVAVLIVIIILWNVGRRLIKGY